MKLINTSVKNLLVALEDNEVSEDQVKDELCYRVLRDTANDKQPSSFATDALRLLGVTPTQLIMSLPENWTALYHGCSTGKRKLAIETARSLTNRETQPKPQQQPQPKPQQHAAANEAVSNKPLLDKLFHKKTEASEQDVEAITVEFLNAMESDELYTWLQQNIDCLK